MENALLLIVFLSKYSIYIPTPSSDQSSPNSRRLLGKEVERL